MSSKFFQHKNSTLHYNTIGSGPVPLFMFHGFGQDQYSFHALSNILADHYTAYIFDLYFHGQSTWGYDETPLEKEHWKEIVQLFLEVNEIREFSVVGFSLGGKFALATVEAFPEKIKELILLAPDGIKISFWYRLATYPLIFRRIFKSMIRYHERFQSVVKLLQSLKLVDKSVLKFATFQMNSEEKRNRVYYSWVVFRHLTFDLDLVANLINEYQIPLTMIVGQYDKVIQPRDMERFLKKVKHYTFETPPAGHTGLIAQSGQILLKKLKDTSLG